jgi:hypothetical protein
MLVGLLQWCCVFGPGCCVKHRPTLHAPPACLFPSTIISQGKTFQCMLAFKKLGITPIVMSAGELESGNAGEPAKLIRQRYREASDQIKKVGLFRTIQHIDMSGCGRGRTAKGGLVKSWVITGELSPRGVGWIGVVRWLRVCRAAGNAMAASRCCGVAGCGTAWD